MGEGLDLVVMAPGAMMASSLRCSSPVPSCIHGEALSSSGRISSVAFLRTSSIPVALKRKGVVPVFAALGLEKSDGLATNGRGTVEEALPGQGRQGQRSSMEVDLVSEAELKENGFRSTRRTKLICTIGPATCAPEQLEALAMGGMNVARLNMCHSTREWHTEVIRNVRNLNSQKGYSVAVMMDTEGSEIHMGDFNGAPSVKAEVFPLHQLGFTAENSIT